MTTAASCIDSIERKQLGQMLVLFIVAYSEREQPHKCQRQKKKNPPPTITRMIMNLQASNKHIKETRGKWIKTDGKQQKRESTWTLLDLLASSSSFFLHLPPFLLTRITFHFRCGLSPLFLLCSAPRFFLSLSVPLCQLVWCRCSWTPPLTDNSRDGTLLSTAQCTAILPQ